MKNVEDIYPLSPMQQGLLFLRLYSRQPGAYVEQVGWSLEGTFDETSFVKAWQEVIEGHPVLRTGFFWDDLKEPMQVVRQKVHLPWQRYDWRKLTSSARHDALQGFLESDRRRDFDLRRAPLLRLSQMRLSEDSYQFIWTYHHLILDGWSVSLVLREVFQRYKALCGGASATIENSRPFRDYIEWLQHQSAQSAESYWREKVRGFNEPTTMGIESAETAVSESVRYATQTMRLSVSSSEGLRSFARRNQLTLSVVVEGAWALLLSRYSSSSDVLFGVVVNGRPSTLAGAESMVGLFINTLPMRVRIEPDARCVPWLQKLHLQQVEMRRYEHTSLARIQEWSEVPRGQNLFKSIVAFDSAPAEQAADNEQEAKIGNVFRANTVTNYPITLGVVAGPALSLDLTYDAGRFDRLSITRMLNHLENLMLNLGDGDNQNLGDLPMLSQGERQQLVTEWNDTEVHYHEDVCLPQLIEAQAERNPRATAAICENTCLTYGELNHRANAMAHKLRSLGAGPETIVGICAERSLELVWGLLAIMKAGAAYLPIDPSYPKDRLAFMLRDAEIKILITQRDLLDFLPEHSAQMLFLDEDPPNECEDNPRIEQCPESIAYVIYTSGSTGTPKAVLNSHQGIVNRLRWMQDAYRLSAGDCVLQKTPFTFDVSVWEFFWPLMAGARLVLAKPGGHKDNSYLIELIAEHHVSTVHFVPSMLRAFLETEGLEKCRAVKRVISSGEELAPDLQELFFDRLNAELYNLYGPTEAAVDVTSWHCRTDRHCGLVPIGRPISNVRIYLLDRRLQPVPVGVAGELHIGGTGLARGYLNRSDLTAERFVPDPFSGRAGARLYKTGDLARFLTDGNIQILGRLDHQVKIRGFRIELGEIESKLIQHPAVCQAVVVAARAGQHHDKHLVAYYTSQSGCVPRSSELRQFLKERLPDYMLPSSFFLLEDLPVTTSGKIDRQALPAPGAARPEVEEEFIGPRSPAEKALVAIWKEVLGIDEVGIYDNFFELGGDSIMSMQIMSKAKKAGLNIVPKDVFEQQNIALLAAIAAPAKVSNDEQGNVHGPVALTPIQQWFLEQRPLDPHHFNQAVWLEARQILTPRLMKKAIESLAEHHDALRLRFVKSDSGWQQINSHREDGELFLYIDLSNLDEPQQQAAIRSAAMDLNSGLNLVDGPILRLAVFHLRSAGPDRLLWVIHHLAVDGVSWRILLEDLQTAYEHLRNRMAVTLPPKTTSFKKWSERLSEYANSEVAQKDAEYWLAESRGSGARLPRDFVRGENTTESAANVKIWLSAAETRALLHEIPRLSHLQISDVLLAALFQVFTRWTGQNEFFINLEGHGRESLFDDLDVTRTVGWFTSIFPLRLNLTEASQPDLSLRMIKEKLRSIPDRGLSYGLLAYLNQDTDKLFRDAGKPEVCFNYLGQLDQIFLASDLFRDAGEAPGLTQSPRLKRSHLLDIDCGIVDRQLVVLWTYSENFHLRSTIEHRAQDFIGALRALIAYCQSPDFKSLSPSDFPLCLLTQQKIDELTHDGPPIEDLYPLSPMQEGMLFHSLRSPQSTVYCEQMSFSIRGELDVENFEKAWLESIERHSILRTSFVWKNLDEPVQIVYRCGGLHLEREDWRGFAPETQSERLFDLRQADRNRGFDFSKPPLMRLKLIRMGERCFEVVWTYHHILLDGWSVSVLLSEVLEQYESLRQGRRLRRVTRHSYREYIAWLKQQDIRRAEAFWRARLEGFATPTPLLMAVDETPIPDANDAYDQQEIRLSRGQSDRLRSLAREHHLTLSSVAQGCWALLLSRYSGEEDVVFGVTVSGRPPALAEAETMIGLFINTLPVRVQWSEDDDVLIWLKRLQANQAEALDFSYSQLSQVQGWSDLPRGVPLFESLMVFENYPLNTSADLGSTSLEIDSVRTIERTDYALTVVIVPGEELTVRLLYDCRRFEHTAMTRLLIHLRNLFEGITAGAARTISELCLNFEAEDHAALVEWNDTQAPYPASCFHHLVEEQVTRTPEALAVSCRGQGLSYRQFNERANQLSHFLCRLGVGLESRVAICVGRSSEMVIARLAVLKAGGAYLSLDPEYPTALLDFMLEDAAARVLITEERFLDRFDTVRATVLCLERVAKLISQENKDNPMAPVSADNLAYVYYTSGSTGKPKGVEIEHRGLVNLVTWHNHSYQVKPEDRKSQLAGLGFDASVWELWPYLVAGASVHIPDDQTRAAWPELLKWMVAERITISFLPTPLAEAVMDDEWPAGLSLRALLTGGDKLHRWPQQRLPFLLVNKYGPTEVTAVTTWAPLNPATAKCSSPPIGRPIANTRCYVLDDNLRSVPVGAPGQLYIGGTGLARGYLNRPGLTAEKFVPDPFSGVSGARLYKSGDLVRRLPDGNIDFLGRQDHQVQIRGYRIELGEIEKSLAEHPAVREAVVLVNESSSAAKELSAYFVPSESAAPAVGELRDFLRERLPAYMVPSSFVSLKALPLTRNGKIDRRALAVLAKTESAPSRAYAAPESPEEIILAGIWAQVLGLERVGVDDNFFELGGDSILSIRIISRAAQHGIELSPNQLFLYPTIRELVRQFPMTIRARASSRNEVGKVRSIEKPGPAYAADQLTPADFPNADLDQHELDDLLARFAVAEGAD